MRISGEELLRTALEQITGGEPAEDDVEAAAGHSAVFLDGLDKTLLAGGVSIHELTLPARATLSPAAQALAYRSFVWGPGGAIDGLPPSGAVPDGGVQSWSFVRGGEEEPRGAPINAEQLQSFAATATATGEPLVLWRDRSATDGGESATFRVYPNPDDAALLRLYARTPALRSIDRGASYDLPEGVGAYLGASLAVFEADTLSLTVPPSLANRQADYHRRLTSLARGRNTPVVEPYAMRIGRWRAGRRF